MYCFFIVTIFLAGIIFFINKINIKEKFKFLLKVLWLIIVLEIYVFNFNSLRLLFKEYNIIEYSREKLNISDIEYDEENDIYNVKGDNPTIEINDINEAIGTIMLDIETKNTLNYKIFYTDETSKNYRELPIKTLINENERSKYVTCYLSGKSNKIKIELKSGDINFKINSISINKTVPFSFNLIRMFILFFTIIFVTSIFKSKIFNMPLDIKNNKQTIIICFITILFGVIVIWIGLTSSIENSRTTIYNEDFVDAIIAGQINLLKEPSEELINLDNPYDLTQRENVEYLWDVAYYNNLYYIYFGILPALILFVPFKLLTGKYLLISVGMILFSIIIIIKLVEIIYLIYKKWFKNLNFSWLVLALIIELSGSLLFWVNRRPYVYELVLTAGICFCSIGFVAMFKAMFEKEEIQYKQLFLGALSLALAVACRPNLLLVSLIFLPELIKRLIQNIKSKKERTKFLLTVGLPYVIVGILLMIYNYARFDSIFEFRSKISINC